jgi:hypothetical protein
VRWQLYVLDLRTGAETALGKRRSVDDQLVGASSPAAAG